MDPSYRAGLPLAALVRDFMAAMTDDYLLRCYKDMIWPRRLPSRIKEGDNPVPGKITLGVRDEFAS